MRLFILFLSSLLLAGCVSKDPFVMHPDSPVLIQSGRGTVTIAIYDRESNTLVGQGTVNLADYVGWTIHKYDWDAYIEDHE